jgi:hypothetical protein
VPQAHEGTRDALFQGDHWQGAAAGLALFGLIGIPVAV